MHFKIIAVLSLLLFSVSSWARCESTYGVFTPNNVQCVYPNQINNGCCTAPSNQNLINACNNSPDYPQVNSYSPGDGWIYTNGSCTCGSSSQGYYCNVNVVNCTYMIRCNNECEADSVQFGGIIQECQYDIVENKWYKWTCTGGNSCQGGYCQKSYYNNETLCVEKYCQDNPTAPECVPPCDSTKWTCNTITETTQTSVASDNITCIEGTCFGLTYCDYVTRNTTECDNECGTHTEQTNEIPMRYEGACNDDNLSDDNMCSATKCIESNGQYSLYQMCQSRMINNGEIQLLPRMVGGGMGSCKNAGYKRENDSQNDSTGTSSDSLNIPLECFQFGINCPEPDSSLTDPENRTPENGCICEPFDGQKNISQVICPDGSMSVIYSSCDDWKNRPSSSSSGTPESSSSAEQPASSSGASPNDWTTWSQGEEIKAALAVIAANTAKSGNNQVVVQQNQEFLNQFEYQDDGTEPQLNIPDSMLTYDSTFVDTNGILQAIFGRLDSSNKILDTISTTSKVCPCLTFFSGNQNTSFANGHIQFKELVIDMASFHGYNLCTIISAIVVALASVVSFFIGFSIFKNISQ